MEGFIESLGLNWWGFALHSLNFLVLLVILRYILWRPVMRRLDERERQVREATALIESAEARRDAAEQQAEQMVADARAQASDILARAREQTDRLLVEARAAARTESERIIARGRQQADSARQQP
jgi:F-type H+-transporting ATPase subunit b